MSLADIHIKNEYRSLLDNVVTDFYIPVLQESILYQRAVGFFSSSALIAISKGVEGLVANGGKIQICLLYTSSKMGNGVSRYLSEIFRISLCTYNGVC